MSHSPISSAPLHKEAMSLWMQEIAPFGILTTDSALRISSWNQWLATHSGIAPEIVVGRPLFEVFPDIEQRRLGDYFHRALAGEVSVLSTALHRYLLPMPSTVRETFDPQMRQTARIAPLNFGEKVMGTITIIEDVSQREFQAVLVRRQHAREQLLSWALAHLLQSVDPLKDVSALFPKISEEFQLESYFTYLLSPAEKTALPFPTSGLTTEQEIALLPSADGEPAVGENAVRYQPVAINRVQTTSESHFAALRAVRGLRAYTGFPLQIGDRLLGILSFASYGREVIPPTDVEFLSTVSKYVAIALDRALRENTLRETQRSLREHAEGLEAKVAERTARLHEIISQLESFSYSVAHDLKAPIRALKAYCEILLEDYAALLPVDGREIIAKLFRASDRLDNLTRDLLKFSKVSMQNVELTVIELSQLVEDIVLLTPALKNHLAVAHAPLGKVWGQRTLIQQCLSNLFDNSLKFVGPNLSPRIVLRTEVLAADQPEPTVTTNAPFNPAIHSYSGFEINSLLTSKPREVPSDRRLRLWVEDNGIGIAPELHQKIFGIFERGGGGANMPEGTGIGLAIVARAMQQMGGSCGVESTVGGGSRFWLEFRLGE